MTVTLIRKIHETSAVLAPKEPALKRVAELAKKVENVAFPILRSPSSKKIRFKIDSSLKAERVIYKIEGNGKIYIGKSDHFGTRLSKYTSDIHLQGIRIKKTSKTKDLLKAIHDSPEDFKITALKVLGPDDDINQLEKDAINEARKSVANASDLINVRSGGGGGISVRYAKGTAFRAKGNEPTTPPRLLALDPANPKLTPKSDRLKSTVYEIIIGETRYVGRTVRNVGQRIREHFNAAKNESHPSHNTRLSQEIRKAIKAEQPIRAGVLGKAVDYQHLVGQEAHFIKIVGEKHKNLLNANKGSRSTLRPPQIDEDKENNPMQRAKAVSKVAEAAISQSRQKHVSDPRRVAQHLVFD